MIALGRHARAAAFSALAVTALGVACSSSSDSAQGARDASPDAPAESAAGGAGAAGSAGTAGQAGAAGHAGADAGPGSDAGADADPLADVTMESAADAVSDYGGEKPVYDAEPFDGSACNAVMQEFAPDPGIHVPLCSAITWPTNPPCSGEHYPIWAAYKTYTQPVPRGFWVHDLEHGAIVITYNCPTGCAAEVAQAQAMIDAVVDQVCLATAALPRRIVMTPDPLLDVKWAAAAWGFTLRADCFDHDAFLAFIQAHYNHSPEDTCADGWDFTADGGFTLPPGCVDGG